MMQVLCIQQEEKVTLLFSFTSSHVWVWTLMRNTSCEMFFSFHLIVHYNCALMPIFFIFKTTGPNIMNNGGTAIIE